jgi:hypothetical protein
MGFKETIENHPFVYLISVAVVVVSITAGVLLFFTDQKIDILHLKHSLKISQIERQNEQELSSIKLRLASIERRMGEATDWFDVRSVMVSRQMASRILPNSHFFAEDHFYALKPEAPANWAYEQTTEFKLLNDITRLDLQSMPVAIQEALTLVPVHLWRSNDTHRIEGSKSFKSLFSYVFVQRLPHKLFPQIIGVSISDKIEAPSSELPDLDMDKDKIIKALESFYRGDATGTYLTFALQLELLGATAGFHTELTSIQKKGNVVYAQLESILSDVVVDGKKHGEFYLIRELMLISTPSEMFLVKTLIPTPDRRSDDFQWISGWFGNFAIPQPL